MTSGPLISWKLQDSVVNLVLMFNTAEDAEETYMEKAMQQVESSKVRHRLPPYEMA